MPSDVTRDEFQHLATRTDIVEGEKLVTRHILEQTRRNGDDLATIKTRLDRVDGRLDKVETRLGSVEHKVDGLAHALPGIVGEAVREAFREERDRKP